MLQAANGVWHEMNDSHVSVVSLSTVLACQAYILFYSKSIPVPTPASVVAPVPVSVSAPTVTAANSSLKTTATDAGVVVKAVSSAPGAAQLVRTPAASSSSTSSSTSTSADTAGKLSSSDENIAPSSTKVVAPFSQNVVLSSNPSSAGRIAEQAVSATEAVIGKSDATVVAKDKSARIINELFAVAVDSDDEADSKDPVEYEEVESAILPTSRLPIRVAFLPIRYESLL